MRAPLRPTAILILGALAHAQQIDGPGTARSGEQHFYRLSAPPSTGEYRWHLEWNDASGSAQSWEGNENRPALNLSFPAHSGPHRLWAITRAGNSNALAIVVAPSTREPETTATALTKPLLDVPSIAVIALTPPPSPRPSVPFLPEPRPVITSPRVESPIAANTIITADDRDVIDLVAGISRDETATSPNPFRVRYQPKLQTREITLNVGLVHVGQDPRQSSVVINGELYGIGDAIETLTVATISPEWIELRTAQFTARIPVQDRPVVLRLPR